jgi:hypothetical protein
VGCYCAAEAIGTSAAFAQAAATWAAVEAEDFDATATFAQSGTWTAGGALALDATAAFAQAAATWIASEAPLISGSATFDQSATWDASGDVTVPAVVTPISSGRIRRRPTRVPYQGPDVEIGPFPVRREDPVLPPLRLVASAAFAQQPATFLAYLEATDPDEWLLLGLDMAA